MCRTNKTKSLGHSTSALYLSGTIFLIEIVTHLGDLRGDARLGFELLEFLDQQLQSVGQARETDASIIIGHTSWGSSP